jgi:hypothetical protein
MNENNTKDVKLLSYDQAKDLAKALGIKNFEEWKEFYKSHKFESKLIPLYPELAYKEWRGWEEFLDVELKTNIIPQPKSSLNEAQKRETKQRFYLSYEEAKEFLKDKSLTFNQWKEYLTQKPDFIPNDPYQHYRYKGWVNWKDFLNYKRKITKGKDFLTYEEAKEFLKDKGLTHNDWREYKKTMPSFLPKNPFNQYRYKGWVDWADFLSYEKYGHGSFVSYEEAKEFLKDKGLKNKDWRAYTKNLPRFIPKNPYSYYQNKGWVSWNDFLSYENSNNIIEKKPLKKSDNIPLQPETPKASHEGASEEGLFKKWMKPLKNLFTQGRLIIEDKYAQEKAELEHKIQCLDKELAAIKNQQKTQEEKNHQEDEGLINDLLKPRSITPEVKAKIEAHAAKVAEHWASLSPNEEKQTLEDQEQLFNNKPLAFKKDEEKEDKEPSFIDEKGLKALLTLYAVKTYPEYLEFRNQSPKKDELPLVPHKHYNDWDGWQSFFNTKVKKKTLKVNTNVKDKVKDDEHIPSYRDLHPTSSSIKDLTLKLKKDYPKLEGLLNSGKTFYYLPYERAKEYAHSLNLKSKEEWDIILEDLPFFIPHFPDREYKEFESWEKFLGYTSKPILPTFKKEEKAKHTSKEKIPPIKYTMNKDGTVSVLSRPPAKTLESIDKLASEKHMQFEKAKEIVKKFSFKNEQEYKAYLFKPKELPEFPELEFAKKGWVDWDDFLGLVHDE